MNVNSDIAYINSYLLGKNGLDAYRPQQPSTQRMSNQASLYELRAKSPIPASSTQYDTLELSSTASLQKESGIVYNAGNFESILKNWVKDALGVSGIGLDDIDSLEIGLNSSGQITVSGLKSDSDNRKLADALNRKVSQMSFLTGGIGGDKDFSTGVSRMQVWAQRMFYRNSDWAMSAPDEFERDNRATLIYMKNNASGYAEEYTGIALDYSQLYRTEDGKIAGYPKELAWYFEAEIVKPNIYESSKTTKQEGYALSMRHYANSFLDAGYDNIPTVDSLYSVFKFEKNDLL